MVLQDFCPRPTIELQKTSTEQTMVYIFQTNVNNFQNVITKLAPASPALLPHVVRAVNRQPGFRAQDS